jgi:hypothetical protein
MTTELILSIAALTVAVLALVPLFMVWVATGYALRRADFHDKALMAMAKTGDGVVEKLNHRLRLVEQLLSLSKISYDEVPPSSSQPPDDFKN